MQLIKKYLSLDSLFFRIRHCFVGLFIFYGQALGASPPWAAAAYSYFADATRLEKVLAEFASGFNLSLSIEPSVTGSVSGRFTSASPTEFISLLASVYGFVWYTHAGVLYVSRASDMAIRSFPIPAGGLNNLRSTLTDLGVVEPRFGWGELPAHGILIVSGPLTYLTLVEETLRQLPAGGATARQIRVFRLQHASSEDRTIAYRDQKIVQPGLASVMRGILGSGAAPPLIVDSVAQRSSTVAPLPALGASNVPPVVASSLWGQGPPIIDRGSSSVPTILSDPRLNAIIVSDAPEKMTSYERLIAELDVPSALIEIEAMIIDVNTERARELGINWSLRSGGSSASFSVGDINISSGGDAASQLIAQIRLLEKTNDARIQSRPSVLTTDNIGAILDLSETFYVRVQGERVASVSPVTFGTTLKVTPRLIRGEFSSIQLTVDIEDGQIQDRQIDSLPTVRRSNVSTQAVVRSSETLLIAGYSSDQNLDTVQKVPLLGDLPLVGTLFSNKSRTLQKRERLFLIRPKLVPAVSLDPSLSPVDGLLVPTR